MFTNPWLTKVVVRLQEEPCKAGCSQVAELRQAARCCRPSMTVNLDLVYIPHLFPLPN